MNAITERFGRRRVLLPVIHAVSPEQVRAQAEVVAESGADGLFIINQGGMDADDVLAAATTIGQALPGFFIGINLLGVRPTETSGILSSMGRDRRELVSGLWADDAEATAWGARPARDKVWSGLYFGGVAFKGQRPVPTERLGDVAAAAKAAGVSVITTSGANTGKACLPSKAAAMREAIGGHALALASGITIGNVESFLPVVDAFIVASSIERRFGEFDPGAVRALADRIHAG